jgi:hypothetical protein
MEGGQQQQAKTSVARLEDSDLDDDRREEGLENGEKKDDGKEEEEKKKKPRKPLLKLDPNYLIDNPRGLKRLYKHMVMDFDKNLRLKGKGHEVNDFNRVM